MTTQHRVFFTRSMRSFIPLESGSLFFVLQSTIFCDRLAGYGGTTDTKTNIDAAESCLGETRSSFVEPQIFPSQASARLIHERR